MTRFGLRARSLAFIFALPFGVGAHHADAAIKAGCAATGSLAGFVVCNDDALAGDDHWVGTLMKERLAMADKATAKALRRDQRAFLKERESCMPPAPKAQPAADDQSAPPPDSAAKAPAAGAPADQPPPAAPQPGPGAAKTADAPPPDAPAPSEADAEPAAPQPSEAQILGCLRSAYHARIDALEGPLRHPADLIGDAPGAPDICVAIGMLQAAGKLRLLDRHAVPTMEVDEADEMHPSVKQEHLRRYMSAAAWQAASDAAAWWKATGLGAVTVSQATLYPAKPPIWVFSTIAGEGHDRNLLLFEGTADGAMADRLIGHLGGDGAGAFETLFVRFKTELFAVEESAGKNATPAAYALDQSKPACAMPQSLNEPLVGGGTGKS